MNGADDVQARPGIQRSGLSGVEDFGGNSECPRALRGLGFLLQGVLRFAEHEQAFLYQTEAADPGAPVTDPARCSLRFGTRRVGDQRSGEFLEACSAGETEITQQAGRSAGRAQRWRHARTCAPNRTNPQSSRGLM